MFGYSRNIRKVLTFLGNLQLAIVLLLVIAFVSSLGTIIEQDKNTTFYELNYPVSKPIFGFVTSNLIFALGLNKIYSTWWFISIVILFGISLLSCTFSRQIPALKLAKLWKFLKNEPQLKSFNLNLSLKNGSLAELSYFLKEDNYNIIHQGIFLYAYRGLVGKLGPILVHISIIFVLFGAIYGVLTGFTLQEIVSNKQLFHLQNVIASGQFSYVDPTFQGYINDFKIAYTDEGFVDQFYSDLSILDNNLKVKFRKTIFVNEPLKYDNLTVYQTDWNIAGVDCIFNDSLKVTLPFRELLVESKNRFWITSLPGDKQLLLVVQDLTGNYLIYNSDKRILAKGTVGKNLFLEGKKLRILRIIPSTGLQIKSDPGISIVYIGFLFLIVSVIFSYTSYSQIWAIKKSNTLYIYGMTNRGVYFFEKKLLELITKLKSYQ